MKISSLVVSSLMLIALMLGACTQQPAEPSTEPQSVVPEQPAEEPTAPSMENAPPEYRISLCSDYWPEPDWAIPFTPRELPADNPEELRELTDEEKDRVLEIALDTPDASEWLERVNTYRAELLWFTNLNYSELSPISYYGALYTTFNRAYRNAAYCEKYEVWYPGVRISFGSPQKYELFVAVDLKTGQVIETYGDTLTYRESNLEWLTKEEQDKTIEIALSNPEMQERSCNQSVISIGFSWKHIHDGTRTGLAYEAVGEGIPDDVQNYDSSNVYPCVDISFGEPADSIGTVVIDLDKEEIVYVDVWPNLSHPYRHGAYLTKEEVEPQGESWPFGEEVNLNFSVTGAHFEPIQLSPWPPEIRIYPEEAKNSSVRIYGGGTETIELQPCEELTYELIWDQKDKEGSQVPPGLYWVEFETVATKASDPETQGEVKRGAYVFVLFSQGVIEKTIDVYQTKMVEDVPLTFRGDELVIDISITLERVELSEEGTKFTAFATSQDWPDLDDEDPQWNFDHPEWGGAQAEYKVDGIIYPCGGRGTSYLQNGVRYKWDVNPIPSDAKELVFIMTRLSEYWQGPWEFHVPLE